MLIIPRHLQEHSAMAELVGMYTFEKGWTGVTRVSFYCLLMMSYHHFYVQKEVPSVSGSVFGFATYMTIVILQCNLNSQRYQKQLLERILILYFADHVLASHPILMDDNAYSHWECAVREYWQHNTLDILLWTTRSLDLNLLEHFGTPCSIICRTFPGTKGGNGAIFPRCKLEDE